MAGNNEAGWMEDGPDDATWVLTSSFVILTMQSGFGLLESGTISQKFQVNVMMKNVIDVIFGGLSFWMVGFGIAYGDSLGGFMGYTDMFVSSDQDMKTMAESGSSVDLYSHYIFQFTFAATATTIVSGCVAGRMKLLVYIVFSFVNTVLYCIPAHWVFSEAGWLFKLGMVDFAGDGPVHLMGGATGLAGAWVLGPRKGRFDPAQKGKFQLQNPLSCIFGLFLLWWGWLGFNCGSTFGISGLKWLVASRVAVTTVNASIGGGLVGVCTCFCFNKGVILVEEVINSILAGLVGITAGCAAISPLASLFVGAIGAVVSKVTNDLVLHRWLVDDPVGAFGVHATAGVWGLLAVGLFADSQLIGGPERDGLLLGGGPLLLGVQALGASVIALWTIASALLSFKILDLVIGLRISEACESAGADLEEHGVQHSRSSMMVLDHEALSRLVAEMEMVQRELTALKQHQQWSPTHNGEMLTIGCARRDSNSDFVVRVSIEQHKLSPRDGTEQPAEQQLETLADADRLADLQQQLEQVVQKHAALQSMQQPLSPGCRQRKEPLSPLLRHSPSGTPKSVQTGGNGHIRERPLPGQTC